MTELKRCPFCGGEARLWHPKEYGITLGSVKCNSCGASTESFTDDDSAIEAWNKRSNWHTGTPTEEGWYLVAYNPWGYEDCPYGYDVMRFKERTWHTTNDTIIDPYLVAWQKITPYEGEEVNGSDN